MARLRLQFQSRPNQPRPLRLPPKIKIYPWKLLEMEINFFMNILSIAKRKNYWRKKEPKLWLQLNGNLEMMSANKTTGEKTFGGQNS